MITEDGPKDTISFPSLSPNILSEIEIVLPSVIGSNSIVNRVPCPSERLSPVILVANTIPLDALKLIISKVSYTFVMVTPSTRN